MAFSQIVSPVTTGQAFTTLPSLPPTSTPSPSTTEAPTTQGYAQRDDTTLIIVASVVSFIVLVILIVLLILLIWCWKRRGSKKIPAQDTKNETWLSYYTKHFYNTPLKDKHKWSNTVDLNEPRYPTINDKYVPYDLPVSDMHHNRPCISFEEEYRHLPSGLKFPYTEAQKPANAERNRFDHILPYDHSRVILRDTANSYINANYIDSYDLHHAYIAMQSPFNEVTMCDFWYMVYQEKVTHIVFLARLVEDGIVKSEIYWPEKGSQLYGVITVQHMKTEVFAHFIVRTFNLDLEGSGARIITQFQFTSWPDHGVPSDPIPFLEFLQKVRRNLPLSKRPLVVHCGTGVSRSAVFIAVDSLLEQAKAENSVNVYRFCNKMRRNRTLMVRTLKQYVFIYDTLFEALITNHNVVGRDLKASYRILSDTNPTSDKSYFREQFEVLERYIPDPKPEDYRIALRPENQQRNRFNTLRLLPCDRYRTAIQNPGALGQKDYINGLFMDSYLTKNTFIVTQTPLETTVTDFWRMIYDYNVKSIAMLNGPDFHEDTCAQYWPDRIGIQKWQQFFVNLVSEKDYEYMTVRHLELASDAQPTKPARTIKQYQFKAWKMYDKVPWSRDAMIAFVEQVEKWQKAGAAHGPIVVHCMDGASQAGLFCACYVMSEKLNYEGIVDIFHTVKHLKTRRSHMINSLVSQFGSCSQHDNISNWFSFQEQYKFCFKYLWDFMHIRMLSDSATNGRVNPAYEGDGIA
jgi:protein tyrosine phosphatase